MSSEVYFVNLRARNGRQNKISKVQHLFKAAGFEKLLSKDDITAVKIHFGERGSDGYINPVFVRQVVDKIKECGAKPFLTDTNTLYSGSRHNAVDHLITSVEHGFVYEVVGAPVIIADGVYGGNIANVEINKKHFKYTKIAGDIVASDSMIVMTHFKGHEMAGFGGSIKNLAMGCAPAVGKEEQHSVRLKVNEAKCIGCKSCVNVCPKQSIKYEYNKSNIDKNKCIGCGECMTVCPARAIELDDWGTNLTDFTERLTEYAFGAINNKTNKVGFMNFLINITPDCDCATWSDAPIVPDIGILASTDPVAIDKASYDLVNAQIGFNNSYLKCNHEHGDDKFKGMRKNTVGEIQISYGEEIGLGTSDYKLIEI
jgi:uncharacterized protein